MRDRIEARRAETRRAARFTRAWSAKPTRPFWSIDLAGNLNAQSARFCRNRGTRLTRTPDMPHGAKFLVIGPLGARHPCTQKIIEYAGIAERPHYAARAVVQSKSRAERSKATRASNHLKWLFARRQNGCWLRFASAYSGVTYSQFLQASDADRLWPLTPAPAQICKAGIPAVSFTSTLAAASLLPRARRGDPRNAA
jgi:hypothetical protein